MSALRANASQGVGLSDSPTITTLSSAAATLADLESRLNATANVLSSKLSRLHGVKGDQAVAGRIERDSPQVPTPPVALDVSARANACMEAQARLAQLIEQL